MKRSDVKNSIERSVRESIRAAEGLLAAELEEAIARIAEAMTESLRDGRKVIAFGNGGSAAQAEHMAAELVGRFRRERDPIPALALPTNVASLTAIANDLTFDELFSRQLAALANPGDVAIGISTSGLSTNVVLGLQVAGERGAATVALTGGGGQDLVASTDHGIAFPASDTARIQEGHLLITHILCGLVEDELFGHDRP